MQESLNTFNNSLEAGLCLISKPELLDPSFLMSVTLICDHNEEGSFGLVLNRQSSVFIDPKTYDLSEKFQEGYFPVNIGGPVQLESVFYLYKSTENHEESKLIKPNVYLGYSKDLLVDLLPKIPNEDIIFFIGYAGWSFYQLDCEFSSGSWFSHQLDVDFIFRQDKKNFWLDALGKIGPDFLDYGKSFFSEFDN